MLKNHWRIIALLERFGDNLIVVAAFFFSYYARDGIQSIGAKLGFLVPTNILALGAIDEYLVVLGFSLLLYSGFLSILGGYRSMRLSTWWSLLRLSIVASALVFLCQGFFLYLFKLDLSRSFVGLFCVLSGLGLFFERILMLRLLRYFRVRGRNFRNVLIVGTGQTARQVFMEVIRQQEFGLRVVGFVDAENQTVPAQVVNGESLRQESRRDSAGKESNEGGGSTTTAHSEVYDLPARVVATANSFEAALKRYAVDEVLFTDVAENFSSVRRLAEIAVEEGVRVTLAADLFSLEIFKSEMSYFGSIPLIHYHPSPGAGDSGALMLKRAVDIVLSALLLILLFPLLLVVAFAIKVTSSGSVFFRQRRVGLNGRHFTLLKFRSMVDNAEELLPQLRELNEMTGPVFKMRHDPRITRVGRFIRHYSIDELPQLINVFRGDMSLVGPRPPLPNEVSFYLRKQRKRLSMRPGLTCTWQVSGRNNIPDFERWAELDLEYIDNWSLWTDLKLLIKTIPVVFSGSGAQ